MLFIQQTMYDLSDDDEEANEDDGAAGYKYADFFVDEKSDRSRRQTRVVNRQKKPHRRSSDDDNEDDNEKKVSGDDENSYSEGENDDDFDDSEARDDYESSDDGEHAPSEPMLKSKKALQQKSRLSSQISELEEDLLAEKSWELRGEVRATDRPENSFLSLTADIERYASKNYLGDHLITLEIICAAICGLMRDRTDLFPTITFDIYDTLHRSSKPAPLVTQDFTYSLEDMIRRRVKEGAFNDVLLKVEAKPTAAAAEGKDIFSSDDDDALVVDA